MIWLILTSISLFIWIYLILFRGSFWYCNQYLEDDLIFKNKPSITIIIPARNEAEVLPISLKSLLKQDYQGNYNLILVDDQSEDKTGIIAEKIAQEQNKLEHLTVIQGKSLPQGWSGKLWAMNQGIEYAKSHLKTDYFLLTDADINHNENNLTQLVAKAEKDNLDLVSLMVLLRTETWWEKWLIPAFIFFFQKLYPFPSVNNPQSSVAAAAGGCILIRAEALERIGGISSLKETLIDDCTLAKLVKDSLPANHGIWLGLTKTTTSLRSYSTLTPIWNMVARTAFTQLNYSPWLLIGTLIGMFLTYLVTPLSLIVGIFSADLTLIILSLIIWGLMSLSYYPTVKLYQLSPFGTISLPAIVRSTALPVIAFLYTLMTIDSARRHWQGKGGQWKGRVYK